jgi:hypothetical protein
MDVGYRWRRMYYATGLPGWVRFGYSPGWLGRSPGGLSPIFQYGMVTPTTPQVPTPMPPMSLMSKEDQIKLLKRQRDMLKKQLEDLERRLAELEAE